MLKSENKKILPILSQEYLTVFSHIKKVASHFSASGGSLITVQDTGGDFGCSRQLTQYQALHAGLPGIIKTAAQEWPKTRCKAIDIACGTQMPALLAKRLFDEIMYDDEALEVGLSLNNTRLLPVLMPATRDLSVKPYQLPNFPVFLVTGGAKGITAHCLIALAKKQKCRFILLGRSEIIQEPSECQAFTDPKNIKKSLIEYSKKNQQQTTPKQIDQQLKAILASREIIHTVSILEQLGCPTKYISVDITDVKKLSQVLENLKQQKWQNISHINGIIHGAGMLADKNITEKTAEQFKSVFEVKVKGLQNILQVTQQEDLSCIILFSSVAGRFGNAGQSDYACANEVLNKIAQYEYQQRHQQSKPVIVKSLNWGPWDGGMVTAELKALFLQRNIQVIPIDTGSELFVSELTNQTDDQIEIIYGKNKSLQPVIITKTVEINILKETYLKDHQIHGNTVLPACVVLDWFMRALPVLSDQKSYCCREFSVLKGIQLQQDTEQFNIDIQSISLTQFVVSLKDLNHHFRYRATFFIRRKNSESMPVLLENQDLGEWPWLSVADIYHSKEGHNIQKAPLFHGQNFQSIVKLLRYSPSGGSALLTGLKKQQWPAQPWEIDVLALDGVLQLLLLWGYAKTGQASLPVSIGEIMFAGEPMSTDLYYCRFDSLLVDKYKTRSNAVLYHQTGQLYARLKNIDMCMIAENRER